MKHLLIIIILLSPIFIIENNSYAISDNLNSDFSYIKDSKAIVNNTYVRGIDYEIKYLGNNIYQYQSLEYAEYNITLKRYIPVVYELPDSYIVENGTIITLGLSLTIQPSLKDSRVRQIVPNNNYGSSTSMYIDTLLNDNWRSEVQFNITSAGIPTGSNIINATLGIYFHSILVNTLEGRTIDAYPNSVSWNETTVTWNNHPGTLAWYMQATARTGFGWQNITVTEYVKSVLNGSITDNGLLLKDHVENSITEYGAQYYTKDYSNASLRPRLIIFYSLNSYLKVYFDSGVYQLLVNSSSKTNGSSTQINYLNIANITIIPKTNYNFFRTELLTYFNHTHYNPIFLTMNENKTIFSYTLFDNSGNGTSQLYVLPNNQDNNTIYLAIILSILISSCIAVAVKYLD